MPLVPVDDPVIVPDERPETLDIIGSELDVEITTDTELAGVTGHQVVYKLIVSVVTLPTGQFVTVGAQEVIV